MSKNTKISLEILTEKLPEFYMALIRHKISSKGDIEALRLLADAIDFDYSALVKTIQLDKAKQQLLQSKLQSVQTYLYNSKKDSEDYLQVSKETLSEFEASLFGQSLKNSFYLMEISRQWTGKADSMEVQAFVAMRVFTASVLMEVLNTAFSKPEKNPSLTIVHKQGDSEQKVNKIPDEQGKTSAKIDEEQEVETEFFIEQEGQIIKVEEDDIPIGIEYVFMKTGDDVIRVKKQGNDPEITPYYNVKLIGNRLDISHTTTGDTYTAPIEPIIIKNEPKEVNINAIKPDASLFQQLEQEFRRFLRLPKNTTENNEVRDEIITGLYTDLKRHYPDITLHASTTITGYIASVMGLIDSEERYIISPKKQTFRKYLRDTVYNILKSHSLINNG